MGEHQRVQIHFAEPVDALNVVGEWVDTKGRICERLSSDLGEKTTFITMDFRIDNPIGYHHSITVRVNGILQHAGKKFMVEYPYPTVWKDYKATVWAHYTRAYGDLLREAGINGGIWTDEGHVSNDFEFYADNILYEMFSYYHKRRIEHNHMREAWEQHPQHKKLNHRRPSLVDEGVYEKMRNRLLPVIEEVKSYRPIFYNLADEIGVSDQSAVSDLDWEYANRSVWTAWVKEKYRDLNSINKQWGTEHVSWGFKSWQGLRGFFPSTYTLYDELWVRHLLPQAFPEMAEFQAYFSTQHTSFAAFIRAYGKIKSHDAAMNASGLSQRFSKKISRFNALFLSSVADFSEAQAFVEKWEQWVAQQDASDSRGWNLSWWCDWREYMDLYIARGLGRARAIGQEADPEGIFGITGTHHPGVFSGHNYSELIKNVDYIMPYDIGQSFELLRGLKKDFLYMHPTWQTTEKLRRDLWRFFLGGCRGVLIWDNHELKNKLIDRTHFTLTTRGQAGAATIKEITNGLDQLLLQSSREDYGIAIYHSMKSTKINWVHQFVSLGRHWMKRQSWHEYRQDERNALRTSWMKLIEDMGLQCIFVTPEQVAEGRLDLEHVKVLILNETWALSDDEARRIQAFAANGGLVIADHFTGLYDGNGKRRETGALDQAMGIDQSQVFGDYRYRTVEASFAERALTLHQTYGAHYKKKQSTMDVESRSKDATSVVRVSSPTAIIGAGDAKNAALIEQVYGQGRFVFLNLDLSHYNRVRIDGERADRRERIVELLSYYIYKVVQPFAVVKHGDTSERQQGVETALWHVGTTRKVLSFTRNIQTNKEGIGGESFTDNALFEKEELVSVYLPKEYHIINQRTGESLGRSNHFSFLLKPFEASLFSVSEIKPSAMQIVAPASIQRGEHYRITMSDDHSSASYLRVYYVQAINPAGKELWYYSKDISARQSDLHFDMPVALNEELGAWTFIVTNIFSKEQQIVKLHIVE